MNLFSLIYNFLNAVLEYEKVYLENLPSCECYEKSYMHRDIISHIIATKYVFFYLNLI